MAHGALRDTESVDQSGGDGRWGLIRSYASYMVLPFLGLATGPILTRALNPEGRGQMAAVLQPLSVAEAVAQLGLPLAVSYAVAKGMSQREACERAWRLGVRSSLAAFLVMAAIAIPYSNQIGVPYGTLVLFWGWPFLSTFIALRRAAYSGAGKFGPVDRERVSSGVLRLALFLAVFLVGGREVLPYLLVHCLAFAVSSYFVMRLPDDRGTTPPGVSFDATYAWSAAPGAIARILNNRLDQAVVPVILSTAALGYYTTAATVAEIPLVLGAVLSRNLLTKASSGAGLGGCRKVIAGAMALGAIPIPLAYVFGGDVMAFIFSEPFRAAGDVLWILCIASLFGVGSQALVGFVLGRGRPGASSACIIGGAVLTVLLFGALWLSHVGSLAAVAWCSCVVQVLLFAAVAVVAVRVDRDPTQPSEAPATV